MNIYEKTLLGDLIGLARATDGNEHLITDKVTNIITDILTTQVSTESVFLEYQKQIESVKREMVPDCFFCANPCGRTISYDLASLDQESPDIRDVKYTILNQIKSLAGTQRNQKEDASLYRGLIAIGLDGYSAAELSSIFSKV